MQSGKRTQRHKCKQLDQASERERVRVERKWSESSLSCTKQAGNETRRWCRHVQHLGKGCQWKYKNFIDTKRRRGAKRTHQLCVGSWENCETAQRWRWVLREVAQVFQFSSSQAAEWTHLLEQHRYSRSHTHTHALAHLSHTYKHTETYACDRSTCPGANGSFSIELNWIKLKLN